MFNIMFNISFLQPFEVVVSDTVTLLFQDFSGMMLLATAVIVCFFFLALSVLLGQHNFICLRAREQHETAGASGAAPAGSFMRHYLNKIPFPLPLRTKDDLIKAGDILDKEDLTPFTRGYRQHRPGQHHMQGTTPTATAVLNYLIQVFHVRYSDNDLIASFRLSSFFI
jgi:hypothetical protein